MDDLLRDLLNRLSQIGESHEEIYDTECREQMGNPIINSFIRPLDDFELPIEFGLNSPEANSQVREALAIYIARANVMADELRLRSFHERLSAFQNGDVKSNRGDYFDDLFGWADPKDFDAEGNVIQTS